MSLFIDYSICNGCGSCAELYPLFFVMRDDRAWVINYDKFAYTDCKNVIYACPFGAISIE